MRAATPPTPTPRMPRRGFTLVELLVVIIIIGLLTGLLVAAIGRALVSSRDARVVAEIAQLDSAMKQFHDNYGMYPPCYLDSASNDAAVQRTFRKMFPRATTSGYNKLNAAEAFVFFLGGPSNLSTTSPYAPLPGISTKTQGFSKNPTSPMAGGGQRSPPLFQFDQGRLQDLLDSNGAPGQNGYYEYYPEGVDLPYVYIDSNHYGIFPVFGGAGVGFVRPYKDQANSSSAASGATSGGYMNPQSFQIISAGQDNFYGANDVNKIFPTGTNYSPDDLDNLTNFSTNRLEESMP